MAKIYNAKFNKNRRRGLRKREIWAEKVLWSRLRNRRLYGYKFRRQQGIGIYIVDFYCKDLNLVVEVDGATHSSDKELIYDKKRQSYLENLDLRVIRFNNSDIYNNIEAVLETIAIYIEEIENKTLQNQSQ